MADNPYYGSVAQDFADVFSNAVVSTRQDAEATVWWMPVRNTSASQTGRHEPLLGPLREWGCRRKTAADAVLSVLYATNEAGLSAYNRVISQRIPHEIAGRAA